MANMMTHRGPDDFGVWFDQDNGVGLGHRRLSILDLSSAGHQPMGNKSGSIMISYNGEIYNFQEHRDELLRRGYKFRGESDTEVLLYLYEEFGAECLKMLNGIFAFAIWDGRKKELLLARDHAGVKPLYYWQNGSRLYFASEIKALLRIPGIPREVNEGAVPTYLTLLWVPGDETMFAGIKKVEPGHALVWKNGAVNLHQWFSLNYQPDHSVKEEEWVERLHDTFLRVNRRQMVSDVPLGAFLSGGLDSSSIVACMRHAFPDREINCYTMAFDPKDMEREGFENDFPFAQRVAEELNVNLKSLVLKPDVVNLLPKIVYHMDEPDADPTAILTYIVPKLAREDGTTVLLSGTGGDEVLFGYRSHMAYRHYQALQAFPRSLLGGALSVAFLLGRALQGAQGPVARRAKKFKSGLMADGLERHMALVDWSSPEVRNSLYAPSFLARLNPIKSIPACMSRYFDGFCGTGEINRHSHILNQTFLAAHNFLYNDKCSMAVSVETRVPFMDVELMQLCAVIPEDLKMKGGITKYLLKKAMERYLPKDVLYRSKTGFGPPLREWVVNGLDAMIQEFLSPTRIRDRGYFDPVAVSNIIEQNRKNEADHGYLIYALLSFEIWMQTFIDHPAVELSV